jgi:electron transport complex protein RnfE
MVSEEWLEMKYYYQLLKNGIIDENPTFVQLIALCPLLAVTTSAINGVSMGLSTAAVMICTSTVISIMHRIIPNEIRIAIFVIIIASFVTITELLMAAYAPAEINEALGIYVPLIVVNCVLFARVEVFASKKEVFPSAIDALGMGLGFTLGLFILGVCREFLGSGSFLGIELLTDTSKHVLIMLMAPGAFFTLGILIMIRKFFVAKKRRTK